MSGAPTPGRLAPWGPLLRRCLAYTVDVVLVWVVLAPLGFAASALLGLPIPSTGPEIARVILWNFSLPVWAYFTLADASASGATMGKRWCGVRVRRADGARVGVARAAGRTLVKLVPWEVVHVAMFALATDLSTFGTAQLIGLNLANALIVVYLGVAVATRGRRSVHDVVAGTVVERVAAAARRAG